MAQEPNHVCKNPKCENEYYACDTCDQTKGIHWRSLCCSTDCFKEYIRVIDERDNPKVIVEEIKEESVAETKRTSKK